MRHKDVFQIIRELSFIKLFVASDTFMGLGQKDELQGILHVFLEIFGDNASNESN